MEKELKKQTDSKVGKGKYFLGIVILTILILLVLLIITLKYLLLQNEKESITVSNYTQDNTVKETDSHTTSDISNENTTITNIENNTVEEETEDIVQEPNNTIQNTGNSVPPTVPENNVNANTNTDANTDVNSNASSSSKPDSNSSGNTSNENNTSNNESSSNPVAPSTPSVVKPYKLKTETSKELSKTETKYGVIINTYTTSTYDLYSDGSKKVTSSYDTIEYDKSNFNAKTSELLPEAKSTRSQYSSMISQVFKNVNSYRQDANSSSTDGIANRDNLSLDENLCVAACARAIEMAYSSKFSHTRPNGSNCFTILKEMNISYMAAGENISYGYSSADSVSEGWKNSQGHYKNMISKDFSRIGIGVFKIEGTYYWVQLFT